MNAAPHLVAGIMDESLQSPFAKPLGEGLSSSTVNVLWGFLNLVLAYLLVGRAGDFDRRSTEDAAAVGLGLPPMGLLLARGFGRFNGGNAPHGS